MFSDFVAQVCAELDISPVPEIGKKPVSLKIGDEEIEMRNLDPGLALAGKICVAPKLKREELFLKLMKGNYLGQETGASRIGMSPDEKFLTLSLAMPYEMTYRTFRDTLEDFVNFILYWRSEIEKFEKQETLL